MSRKSELLELEREIEACPFCRSWGRGMAVPGEGDPEAQIAFIGEAPGREEGGCGRPFVGRSGKLLRAMIREIGLGEKEVFISSPVQYLPRRRTSLKSNVLHSRTHLLKQLFIINPSIVVLLGKTACFALLDRNVEVIKEHGRVVVKAGRKYLITLHPAYAMRFPDGMKAFRHDFGELKKLIGR